MRIDLLEYEMISNFLKHPEYLKLYQFKKILYIRDEHLAIIANFNVSGKVKPLCI